jgi:hypothetical protein
MYVNGKMRPAETISGMGEKEITENDRRSGFSTMIYLIYFKNFSKCYNVPQHSNKNKNQNNTLPTHLCYSF